MGRFIGKIGFISWAYSQLLHPSRMMIPCGTFFISISFSPATLMGRCLTKRSPCSAQNNADFDLGGKIANPFPSILTCKIHCEGYHIISYMHLPDMFFILLNQQMWVHCTMVDGWHQAEGVPGVRYHHLG